MAIQWRHVTVVSFLSLIALGAAVLAGFWHPSAPAADMHLFLPEITLPAVLPFLTLPAAIILPFNPRPSPLPPRQPQSVVFLIHVRYQSTPCPNTCIVCSEIMTALCSW
jgi:hypothetical protein